ncbi:MAG: phage antirepressor Ant [Clostridiales bacterium]|nr:phage antirepressor Ant [Clostridiales bacterium]
MVPFAPNSISSTDTLGGTQHLTVVTESGLYSLVLGSRKPEAKAFKRWITHEVIPTIRKTGGYVNDDAAFVATYLPNVDEQTKALFQQTLATVRGLNAKIEQDKPKVLFADAVSTAHTSILIGELAKILKQNGVEIGQNRLFEFLRNKGYLISRKGTDYNMPTQKSMERGLFEIKETAISHSDGHTSVSKTPKVTGRGQQYFVSLFLGA